ncbi:MAG: FG-GAP repeat domain-containing protein [Sedimentisphaeraceae bacterium JB056]
MKNMPKVMLLITMLALISKAALESNSPIMVESENGFGHFAGDGLTNYPVGAAFVYGSERADVFTWYMPDTRVSDNIDTHVVLYKWIKDLDGIPVFGEPVVCRHDLGRKYIPFEVVEHKGQLYCLWRGGKEILLTRFNKDEFSFEKIKVIDLSDFITSSYRPFTVMVNPDATAEIITVVSEGDYFGDQGRRVAKRGPFFYPYDGRGVWRGNLYNARLYAFSIDLFSSVTPSDYRIICQNPDSVRFGYGQKVTVVNLGAGRERDVMGGGQFGNFHYYHNKSASGINLEKMRYMVGVDGVAVRNPNIDASPIAYPDTKTGLSDILCSSEGLMYYYKFTGKFSDSGSPIYEDSKKVWLKNPALNTGSLPVVNVVDWDGDGVLDIVSGTSNGEVLFSKNTGTKKMPAFTPFQVIKAEGEEICLKPGYRGSIQGPLEARWGYSCPTVVDWNQDGLPDLLVSGTPADYRMYINKGTKSEPKLTKPVPLYHDGLELHGTWRTQPAAGMLGGKMVCIILDDDDQLHMYARVDDYNVEDCGKVKLDDGSNIISTFKYAGGSGRLKLKLNDWDGDGVKDLLIGTLIDHSIPNRKTGLPSSLEKPHASVLFMKNTGTETSPLFAYPQILEFDGKIRNFGVHSCSPDAADLNDDGKKDIVVGNETGKFYFFDGNDVGFKKINPDKDLQPKNCRWQKGSFQNQWNREENWLYGVPGVKNTALIEVDVLVTLEEDACCRSLLLGGSGGSLRMLDGSSMTITNDLVVGSYDKHHGEMFIDGGTIDVGGKVYIAKNTGSTGVLHFNNGVINTSDLIIGGENRDAKLVMDSQATFFIKGDRAKQIQNYIDNMLIVASIPGKQVVSVGYDENQSLTILKIVAG